jgi:hypothetical protein
MKTQVAKYQVPNKKWIITLWDNGSYSCNCPAWIFHRGEKIDCKHILEMKGCGYTTVYHGIPDKNEELIKLETEFIFTEKIDDKSIGKKTYQSKDDEKEVLDK